MRILVTCGPSYEPIDEVRRITNFSTGELGIRLANRLARDGHTVTCFRGVAATRALTLDGPAHVPFSTNDDLLAKLSAVPDREQIGAVFQAAALADFRVEREGPQRKISSRLGAITLTLVPATKLIARLRELFPKAWIVGWKYELDGTRDGVLAKAQRQLAENGTDVCVANGAAYGEGFGVLTVDGTLTHVADRAALADLLAARVALRNAAADERGWNADADYVPDDWR
jgi:phosphopantothenoylcysteine synthetase/decarboxylase